MVDCGRSGFVQRRAISGGNRGHPTSVGFDQVGPDPTWDFVERSSAESWNPSSHRDRRSFMLIPQISEGVSHCILSTQQIPGNFYSDSKPKNAWRPMDIRRSRGVHELHPAPLPVQIKIEQHGTQDQKSFQVE